MIIKFTVGNFLSFKDKVSISFAAKKGCKGHPEAVFETKIKEEGKFIKTAAIYGANASGKSNLIKAIKFFKYFLTEFRPIGEGEIKIPRVNEFLLSEHTEGKPSFFEAEILLEEEVYVYGFEVSKKEIHESKQPTVPIRGGQSPPLYDPCPLSPVPCPLSPVHNIKWF